MQLVDVWCLVLALWFLSIFHFCFLCTQELLLQYCRITVGYSSSPFVRWVNFVSPNYLFFETMYYTGFSSVQSLSRVRLFATPWTAASLSITNSQSLLKLMSIKLVMPSNHLILCRPLLLLSSTFPSIRAFQMSQLFTSGIQSTGVSASASVLPMNIQDWSPLGWTGWISLQSKGLSRVFTTIVQKHRFFGDQLSLWSSSHIHPWPLENLTALKMPCTVSCQTSWLHIH